MSRQLPLSSRLSALATEIKGLKILKEMGLIGGASLPTTVRMLRNIRALGSTGAGAVNAALRFPHRLAVIDEVGSITYRELNEAVNAVANSWREQGLQSGDGVAILARNSRYFLVALYAAGKVGARIILLNTDFRGQQLHEVLEREQVDLIACDEEFVADMRTITARLGTYLAWHEDPGPSSASDCVTLESIIADGDLSEPSRPVHHPKLVVLTSGTTGSPKGAPRNDPRSLLPAAAILERIPFRSGSVVELSAPMFHSLGLAMTILMVALGNTVVVRRRFEAKALLESIETNQSTGLVAVPVMLSRLLDQGTEVLSATDVSSMQVIMAAGSQLGGDLATRVQDYFGPVLRNMYGSTEVAYATSATPEDLAAAPTTVGKPCLGAVVRIIDDAGTPMEAGQTGRIFVRSAIPFDGYTGGGTKQVIDGMLSTGDVGHFDDAGRLFIDGRDDEMAICGGENVYPVEIEEFLAHQDQVAEVAVIGVSDPTFGEVLQAFVVARPDSDIDADGVKNLIRANLARYKVPRDVFFLDQLPRNATGKVLKRELRAIGTNGSPE